MFCSNCGKEIEDGANFCGKCGKNIATKQHIAGSVAQKKPNVKLPVLLSICAVAIILIAVSIAVLGKKADKVTRIVNAYENTINADSFNIHVISSERFRYVYEVFGKGGLKKTYIARYDIRGDFDAVKDHYEEYLDESAHGDHSEGYEYELLANRDFAGLWNYSLGEEIGLTYDEAYDLAIDIASDYLKNRNDNAGVDVDIEDDRYSIYLELEELEDIAENAECYDSVEAFLEEVDELDCKGLRLEVTLEDEYIQSIGFYAQCDDKERIIIAIEFDSVNELTKETSLAYKLFNGLQEEEKASDEMADWRNAYADFFGKNHDFVKYHIIDINQDGIPEIFTDRQMLYGIDMYYVDKENQVNVINSVSGYVEETGLVITTTGSGTISEQIYKYNADTGIFDSIHVGTYIVSDDVAKYDIDGTGYHSYDEYHSMFQSLYGKRELVKIICEDDKDTILQTISEYDQDSIGQAIAEAVIDSISAVSNEEQQANMIEQEVLPAYEKYISDNYGKGEYTVFNLIYIDGDDIPELLFDNTADGRGTLVISYQNGEIVESPAWCRGFDFRFVPGENKVVYSGSWDGYESGTVAYLNNGSLVSEHTYMISYDINTGNRGYSIDDMECSEEEYNHFVETYFRYENMIDGWQTYTSIWEAYADNEELTFGTYGGYVEELEMIGNLLTVKADDGQWICYQVSEDCEWLNMGSDGSVYDNYTFETLKQAITREREYYMEAPEFYESPMVLRITIEKEVITQIRTITP